MADEYRKLVPAVGKVVGNIIPKLFSATQLYKCGKCNAPMSGGGLERNSNGALKHKVKCIECGEKKEVNIKPADAKNILEFLDTRGGQVMCSDEAEHHGAGFKESFNKAWGKLSPAIISVGKDVINDTIGKTETGKEAIKIVKKVLESDSDSDSDEPVISGKGAKSLGALMEGEGFYLPGTDSRVGAIESAAASEFQKKRNAHITEQKATRDERILAKNTTTTLGPASPPVVATQPAIQSPVVSAQPAPTAAMTGNGFISAGNGNRKVSTWNDYCRTQKGKGLSTSDMSKAWAEMKKNPHD